MNVISPVDITLKLSLKVTTVYLDAFKCLSKLSASLMRNADSLDSASLLNCDKQSHSRQVLFK